jgi:TonB family protein
MFLDFEDYRPDTPRVPSVISRREGVLLSLIAHLILVIAYLLMPASWLQPAPQQVVVPDREPVRFVTVAPQVDRVRPPRQTIDQSDLDRRAATREKAPVPENTAPFSRGNTVERTVAAPEEKPVGPESPQPTQPAQPTSPTPPSDLTAKVSPNATAVPSTQPPSGGLGSSLRNLQRYLQDENFNNQKGGLADSDPDIQFDSKGVDFGPWLRRFVAQVKRNWFIPQAAWTLKGHVVIQFYVLRDGTILDIRVVGASAIDSFNTAAFNALKMSNPTMQLPAEYPTDRVFFTVTFHYNEDR